MHFFLVHHFELVFCACFFVRWLQGTLATKTRTHAQLTQLDDRAKSAKGMFDVNSTKAGDALAQFDAEQFQEKREA